MATKMYEIQSKIYEKLNSSNELKKICNGVYDYVPENTSVPYVVFGHIQSMSDNDKTYNNEKVTVTLDVWSEAKGRKETVAIIQAIEKLLSNGIEHEDLIEQKIISRDVVEENYGLYHGTIEIAFQI
jgi:hypothetical protein